MFNILKRKQVFGTGALEDPLDRRDRRYEEIASASDPVDWNKGFDVEETLDIKIPFKNQGKSGSCVGQGWSYYGAVINAAEVGFYDEQSAKAIYSQIELGLPEGGAYIRDGAKLFVNWGSVPEDRVSSYENGKAPTETYMKNKTWKTPAISKIAEVFQAKEYRTFNAAQNMEMFARAIRDNYGVVGGVKGNNNGTWRTLEPKPPVKNYEWGHCLYFGKFGVDKYGKYIATPNSWDKLGVDMDHLDGWQKLREDWFHGPYMFNPWTLIDKTNKEILSSDVKKIIENYEKKFIIEGEGAGRKGIIINNVLREVVHEREANASIYVHANNKNGVTVTTKLFNELPKADNF